MKRFLNQNDSNCTNQNVLEMLDSMWRVTKKFGSVSESISFPICFDDFLTAMTSIRGRRGNELQSTAVENKVRNYFINCKIEYIVKRTF